MFFFFLFLAALGLHCFVWAFSGCSKWVYSLGTAQAAHCGGFSCCGAQAPGTWASVIAAHGLGKLRLMGSRALAQ